MTRPSPLRFFPENVALSVKIVEALTERGIEAETKGENPGPDWHNYSTMYPVINKKGHTEVNCPYECPVYRERGGNIQYRGDECPVADDLFGRVVSVKLNQWYTHEDCRLVADVVNDVLAAHCTQDAGGTGWL